MNYDDDTMMNTVASTPPTKARMEIDELLDRMLIDTIPSPPDLPLGEETQQPKPTSTTPNKDPTHIMDMFANQMNDILSEGGTKIKPASSSTKSDKTDYYKEMKGAFEQYEMQAKRTDQQKEYDSIEAFIFEEQRRTLLQRKAERKLQASEEIKMAAVSFVLVDRFVHTNVMLFMYVLRIRCGVQIWCTRRYIWRMAIYERVIDIVALD